MITIDEALRRFLAAERERAPQDAEQAELLLDNLVSFLDGYGYQYVDDGDHDYDDDEEPDELDDELDDEEEEFAALYEPTLLPPMTGEFLYDWNIRKFLGTAADARATALLMERLMGWLADEGLADRHEAAEAAELARAASEELPRSMRLSDLLHEVAEATPRVRPAEVEEDVDDFLPIVRIEPGRLWFDQDVGPIEVPAEASQVAEVGWWVNLAAEKHAGRWVLTETGFVYPRMVGEDEDEDEDWGIVTPGSPSRN